MNCPYCNTVAHVGYRCPAVKAFEYHPDGTVKRVEFFGPTDYPQVTLPFPTSPARSEANYIPTSPVWSAVNPFLESLS